MAGGTEMTHAQRLESRNRHEAYADQIMDMFAAGQSFRKISAATGVPLSTVQKMCKRLASDYVKQRYGDVTAVLGRELNILDQLTRKNLPAAIRGDKDAAAIVLQSHLRRSRMLGLDAAVRAELTVRTSTDIEIERLVVMLRDNDPAPAEETASE